MPTPQLQHPAAHRLLGLLSETVAVSTRATLLAPAQHAEFPIYLLQSVQHAHTYWAHRISHTPAEMLMHTCTPLLRRHNLAHTKC